MNAGVRTEQWTHIDSNGKELFTFDWEFAPRLSVVYDVFGDGRSKVFGFAGRYYDPIRTDRADFAGALSGPVDEEQIFLGDRWLTYRTRGGTVVLDSVFAPSTKTPYTDEFMLGGSTTLRRDVQLSASLVHRRSRDIFEDFDLAVYSDPNGDTSDGYADENSLFYLPITYFGFDQRPTGVNYVLGTLPGGKRDYTGFELTLQKFRTDNWQGMVSYTYNKSEGNTSSDGSADFAGDVIWLDPRAPNVWAETPGNIDHQFKAFGSYMFDFGLEVSGVFNWNSGF
ncbi:MAG: TonB-dependent receptor, partial [Cytophagaceae bacterium]